MNHPYTAQQWIAILFFGSSLLALLVAIQALRYRQGPVWRYFVYTMLAVAIWAFSDVLFFVHAANDAERWLWTTIGYSASVMSVPAIFAFALYFARLDHWLTPKVQLLLWTPFLLAVALAVTNRRHGLIWDRAISPLQLTGAGGHGAYFAVMLPVTYGLALAAVVVFLQSLWRLHDLYRRQAVVLSMAVLLPVVSSMLYFTDLNPIPGVDLAPAAFAVTGCLLLYGMARLRVMELRPIYRDAVFQHMREGAMILDATGRIVDINPVAQEFLAHTGHTLGDDGHGALARCFAADAMLELSPDAHHLVMTPEAPPRVFDLRVAAIGGQAGPRLLIWRDITQLRAALATIDAQEHLLAARAHAEAELKRDIEHAVMRLKVQMRSALDHLEQGRLGATAALLAEVNTVTTASILRRTENFYASGLQAADFFAAIHQYLTHFAELHDLHLDIHFDAALSADQLTPTLRLHLVRILQAALDNVGAHAQAQQIEARVEHTAHGVTLTVRDDGVGFDPAVILPGVPGTGIAIMQQRMAMIQGDLAITTAPGAGVAMRAFFPTGLSSARTVLHGARVRIAIDHPLTRDGLRAMLLERNLTVDAAVPDVTTLLAATPAAPPDLVLLDIDLPGLAAPATIQQVSATWPATRIVILTEEDHPSLPALFHNGADGYLLKSLPADAFFDALAQIVGGEHVLAPPMATQMLTEFRQQDDGPPRLKSLTARQQEILHLIAQGLTYAEIGAQLHLTERTVRYHVEAIRRRLGLANRNEVALYARIHHLADR